MPLGKAGSLFGHDGVRPSNPHENPGWRFVRTDNGPMIHNTTLCEFKSVVPKETWRARSCTTFTDSKDTRFRLCQYVHGPWAEEI